MREVPSLIPAVTTSHLYFNFSTLRVALTSFKYPSHRKGAIRSDYSGNPESQQPTGSQIIRICMGIYRKIDKTVRMYITAIKVYMPYNELYLCCFLTVSCATNVILESFNEKQLSMRYMYVYFNSCLCTF